MRLIDADKLPKYTGYALSADEVAMAVVNAPTIDPVKHGRWEDCSNGWMCSVCKHDARKDYPYCPHCGAKMDEVEE